MIRAMKKRTVPREGRQKTGKAQPRQPSRDHIHNLRGKFRGKGLMKALMAEKQGERKL